jgi:hypothetical protein
MIDRSRSAAASALSAVALVWIGLLAGVSFLATPAKFLAPSLSLPVALDVGRQTYGIFSAVEIGAALALLAAAATSRGTWCVRSMTLIVAGLVAMQSLWLLPLLDARVEVVLQGGVLEATALHELYIAVDLAKLVLLALVAWSAFRLRHRTTVVT